MALPSQHTKPVPLCHAQKYETPIAEQLGEPTRKKYDNGKRMQRMNNSTHYRTSYWRDFKKHTWDHNPYPVAGGTTLNSN